MNKWLIGVSAPLVLVLQACSSLHSSQERAEDSWETVTLASEAQLAAPMNAYVGLEEIGVMVLGKGDKQSADEHLENAWLALRADADYQLARSELGKVLYDDIENSEAQSLYNQISASVAVYATAQGFDLNADKVVYQARPGDTVASLSEHFYGTEHYFPFLMRVNRLSGTALDAGQEVWIPAKLSAGGRVANRRQTPVLSRQDAAEKSEDTPSQDAVLAESNPVEPSDETLAPAAGEPLDTPPVAQAAPDLSSARAEAEVDKKTNNPQEKALKEKAPKETASVAKEEAEEEAKGLSALAKGDAMAAYHLLTSAPNLSHDGQQALTQLQDKLIETPYSRGLIYYQQQKLKRAIGEFDQVLKADPGHSQANLYRARCQQLLEKLETID